MQNESQRKQMERMQKFHEKTEQQCLQFESEVALKLQEQAQSFQQEMQEQVQSFQQTLMQLSQLLQAQLFKQLFDNKN